MDNWIKAGKIASEAREFGSNLIKENASILKITEKIEEFILKKAQLAFPVQVSINNVAAHQTAFPNDPIILKKSDIVKLDIGVSVDGCIGDTAETFEISSNENKKLIESSEKALEEAIKICQIGTEINKIGKIISEVIESYNFTSIKNLSGHSLDKFSIHSGLNIPNYDNKNKTKLEKGMIIAIEPFATNGFGKVKDGKPSSIYRIDQVKNIRDNTSREILNYILENYKTLPFSKRILIKKFNPFKVNLALNNLEKQKILYQYPLLIEEGSGLVSQTEHTVLIDDKIKVLTK